MMQGSEDRHDLLFSFLSLEMGHPPGLEVEGDQAFVLVESHPLIMLPQSPVLLQTQEPLSLKQFLMIFYRCHPLLQHLRLLSLL